MQILTIIPAWVWLFISAIFFAGGEYLSKHFALAPSINMASLVVVIYSLGVLAWLPAIFQKNQLAITGTIWLLLGLAATVSIGLFVFGERLSILQIIGLVFAFISVALLSL